MLVMILAQVAAAQPPDIELHAVIDAQSIRIEKHGQARLNVWADPDAGSLVKVEAPRANGAKTLRNVRITVDAEARIGGAAHVDANVERSPATEPQPPR